MDELAQKVLMMFEQLNKEALDLHQLFEAGGNDPEARRRVLEIVELLVKDGLFAEQGNDFYSLTDEGKIAAEQARDSRPSELI